LISIEKQQARPFYEIEKAKIAGIKCKLYYLLKLFDVRYQISAIYILIFGHCFLSNSNYSKISDLTTPVPSSGATPVK